MIRGEIIYQKRYFILTLYFILFFNLMAISQTFQSEKGNTYTSTQENAGSIDTINNENEFLVFIISISLLSASVLILILLYRNLKIKTKREKMQFDSLILQRRNLELEKENLLLLNSKLSQEVESKNKELATHVMYLIQKNEFINSVTEKLSELTYSDPKQINKQSLNAIIKQMRANIDKTTWNEFEIRFQQIHKDFYTKLNKKVPNLTLNEKRLCAFLYLNMTTKEISSITFQSVKSIEVARSRLRKKIDIEKDSLISFLQNL